MKFLLTIIFSLGLFFEPAQADEYMTKIIYRVEGPHFQATSAKAIQQTLYRWQHNKGRAERVFDPKYPDEELVIINGRDCWHINLKNNTGRHEIDPSLIDHNFYVPIVHSLNVGEPSPLKEFEIGRELSYVKAQGVTPKTIIKDAKPLLLYTFTGDGCEVDLYVSQNTGSPTECDISRFGKLINRVVYLEYSSGLKPDPSLFQPPLNIKFSED